MNLKETYNKIAEDWHKDHQGDTWWVEGTNTFIAMLKPDARVLDVGCGGGFKSRYLSDRGLDVTGIDFSEKLVEIAEREVPNAEFQVMDMHDLSSLDGSYDAIFSQASLLHIPKNEIRAVLSGFVEKLNSGGLLYIAVKEAWPDKPDESVVEENDYGYSYKRFFSFFTMDELRDHLESLGMEIVLKRAEKTGRSTWLQIIGKK